LISLSSLLTKYPILQFIINNEFSTFQEKFKIPSSQLFEDINFIKEEISKLPSLPIFSSSNTQNNSFKLIFNKWNSKLISQIQEINPNFIEYDSSIEYEFQNLINVRRNSNFQ
jgi:hypothetical protein